MFRDPVIILLVYTIDKMFHMCPRKLLNDNCHFKKRKTCKPSYISSHRRSDIFDTFINSAQELNESNELDLYFQMESHRKCNTEWGKQVPRTPFKKNLLMSHNIHSAINFSLMNMYAIQKLSNNNSNNPIADLKGKPKSEAWTDLVFIEGCSE